MAILNQEEAEATAKAIMQRATTDAAFHAMALKDPNAAVKEVTGKNLPDGFDLRLVSNAGADLTLVLPDLEVDGEELSDSDLEQVAGGRCAASCGGSCLAMST